MENKEHIKELLRTILNDFDELCEVAQFKESKGLDLTSGCGETEINGTWYQIQLHLTPNRLMWVEKEEIRRSKNGLEEHLN